MKKKNFKTKPKQVNTASRAVVIFTLMLIVALLYLVRLLRLQVFSGDDIRTAAMAQQNTSLELQPRRGAILDRNHQPMALSVSVRSIYIYPKEIHGKERDRFSEIAALILGLEKSAVKGKLESGQDTICLKQRLTDDEVEQMKISGLPGFSIVQESARYYPHDDVGAQTLGFLDDEGHGAYGLESQYDYLLSGSSGRLTFSHDLSGHALPTEDSEEIASSPGMNLVSTIDYYIQKSITEVLKEQMEDFSPESITAVMVDPSNGEILGMDSLPSYNVNNPREKMGEPAMPGKQETGLGLEATEKLWMNPDVSTLYEPGSVFKTLTTAISLETKSTSPGEKYLCKGSIEVVPGEVLKCYDWKHPHGEQTLEEALNHSCNPAYIQIAQEIGKEKFYSYLQSLHIGGYSGVDMPAETQSIAPASLDAIGPVELATMSYGHGVAVTPLQMISAVDATINGGYYHTPHLYAYACEEDNQPVNPYQESKAEKIFSDETVETMKKYLHSTAIYYHAPMLKLGDGSFGGKSGTSYIAVNGGYSEESIASYWAFYPLDKPKYSCLVVCDRAKHGNLGGVVGAQTVSKIFEKILQRPAELEEEKTNSENVQVPELKGKTAKECRDLLEGLGLELSLRGDMSDFNICSWQKPAAGTQIKKGSKIQIGPDQKASFKVPDLSDLTEEEVRQRLDRSSIHLSFEGQGRVVFQSPLPDSIVPGDQTLALTLQENTKKESERSIEEKSGSGEQESD